MKANLQSLALAIVGTVLALLASWNLPWTPLRAIGICLLVTSEVLFIVARFQLGASFSVRPQAKTLVTRGLYARIRNPIYTFGGLSLAGLILVLDRPLYLLFFVVLVPVQLMRSRKEEKVLTERFGDTYLRYKEHTWF